MKIVRQSDSELIFRESTLWISVVLALAALPLFYASTLPGERGNLILAIFFAVGALVWLRKATVTFDAAQSSVRWRRMRFFRSASGAVPFADIAGIGTETSSGSGGSTLYRLTLLTRQGSIPFTDTYGGGRDRSTCSATPRSASFKPTAEPLCRPRPRTSTLPCAPSFFADAGWKPCAFSSPPSTSTSPPQRSAFTGSPPA